MKTRLVIILAALVMLVSCEKPKNFGNVQAGDPVPVFSVTLSDGSVITGSSFADREALLVFFSVDCKDCHPVLSTLQSLYESFGKDALIVPIARGDSGKAVQEYFGKNGLTLPFAVDEDRSIYNLFAENGVPRVYLISDGNVGKVWTDGVSFDDLFDIFYDINVVPGETDK